MEASALTDTSLSAAFVFTFLAGAVARGQAPAGTRSSKTRDGHAHLTAK
jgi:hypothetical protein